MKRRRKVESEWAVCALCGKLPSIVIATSGRTSVVCMSKDCFSSRVTGGNEERARVAWAKLQSGNLR
jgi:hypothetical protein